jgi:hypothetical protein
MGSKRDPLPLGTWKITTFAYLPPFNFQPDLLWYVSKDEKAQKLPPVPTARWASPGWTSRRSITASRHARAADAGPRGERGCIRMANWDVLRLSRMIKAGTEAVFQA